MWLLKFYSWFFILKYIDWVLKYFLAHLQVFEFNFVSFLYGGLNGLVSFASCICRCICALIGNLSVVNWDSSACVFSSVTWSRSIGCHVFGNICRNGNVGSSDFGIVSIDRFVDLSLGCLITWWFFNWFSCILLFFPFFSFLL